jgi:integrase
LKALNPNLSPHAFRHSRLQDLADRGTTPWELRDWAGWRDTRPAETYVQEVPEEVAYVFLIDGVQHLFYLHCFFNI